MNRQEELVWKLIDRDISQVEFEELELCFKQDAKLRKYYQDCIETNSVLRSKPIYEEDPIPFPDREPKRAKKGNAHPVTWLGWAAAVLIFVYFLNPAEPTSQVLLSSQENPDWRGTRIESGSTLPHHPLHLQSGVIRLSFPTRTEVRIKGPAYFQVVDENMLEIMEGEALVHHQGEAGHFSLKTPIGFLHDLGTRFKATIQNYPSETKVLTEVLEGMVEFENKTMGENKLLRTGEHLLITGTNRDSEVHFKSISPNKSNEDSRQGVELEHLKTPTGETVPALANSAQNDGTETKIRAIDLMLKGNLKAQINYSMIESIADTIDEKMKILDQAESSFRSESKISFAEAAMPEIEAMAHSMVEGCVDFSKISLWAAAQTAKIAWIENKDDFGNTVQRVPYADRLEQPTEGNRLLRNLEKIRSWLLSVHKIHENKGMGWVSAFGCPEDGKLIFENRGKKLAALTGAINSIKSNLD